ncbi:MAG: hypothetical protein D6733_04790 [Methanobacteriota archaeon]|nr:MAG: hypothetical protein D6733_04790 [Euryarchaeota archaeon]
MARCAYCSKEELLPFTCSYCGEAFCGDHRLPEKHGCRGFSRERWLSRQGARSTQPPLYKAAYEVPGVMEIERFGGERDGEAPASHFDVDEKLVAALILLLILLLGIISRAL